MRFVNDISKFAGVMCLISAWSTNTCSATCGAVSVVFDFAAKGGEKKAFLIVNVGDSAARVSICAEGAPYSLYRLDADHARLTTDGQWTTNSITIPANGLVLALSGAVIEGVEKAGVKQGAVNGLQQ